MTTRIELKKKMLFITADFCKRVFSGDLLLHLLSELLFSFCTRTARAVQTHFFSFCTSFCTKNWTIIRTINVTVNPRRRHVCRNLMYQYEILCMCVMDLMQSASASPGITIAPRARGSNSWNMVFPTVFHLTSRHVSFLNSWTEKSKNSKNMNFRTWTKFFCCKMNLGKCICPGWTTWTSTFEFVLYQLDNLVPVLVDVRGFWRFRLERSKGWSWGLLWIDKARAKDKTYIWVSV
jgi:hypothetical protein